jgi:hypothetical protein
MYASSSGMANGTGACGSVTRFPGAFMWPKPRSAHSAATSLAIPQRGVASSTTIRRPGLRERGEDRRLVERRERS